MGTKNNPGKFDCYAKAEPDEPMFVLLARDPIASFLVDLWRQMHLRLNGNGSTSAQKADEAHQCVLAMEKWADHHNIDLASARHAFVELVNLRVWNK